ncbi:MAG: prepilin-type N-terminal cleavage/methylation domain-containing protein [Bacilli bacterium]|nr:prepilin-type N-terminal cleavage/methylation domain-containing protein [Bacilli bacterium]MDD4547714.1 prepilin-type N-terminal cleavage/methylation domain-containing protein [Bacilli bacterium]
MKKNKLGFTLIELLAVMLLLGLIFLIAYPGVDKYIKEARDKMYNDQVNNIVLSTKNWAIDNKLLLPKTDGETKTITIGELIDQGYVEVDIRNPKTKKLIPTNSYVKITKNGNLYDYEFILEE